MENNQKAQSVEEAAKESAGGLIDDERYEHIEGFIAGAQWQSQNTYTREEIEGKIKQVLSRAANIIRAEPRYDAWEGGKPV